MSQTAAVEDTHVGSKGRAARAKQRVITLTIAAMDAGMSREAALGKLCDVMKGQGYRKAWLQRKRGKTEPQADAGVTRENR